MPNHSMPYALVAGPTKSPIFTTLPSTEPLSKKDFKHAETSLRQELLDLQSDLRKSKTAVYVVLCGVDGAGKGELSNLLSEWLDPRGIVTCAYDEPSKEERDRPEAWRFWRDLPRRGSIGVFLSAWYHRPLIDKAYDEIGETRFERSLDRIRAFENTLADDGTLILKIWMHLDKDQQELRFKALESDPRLEWRVTPKDWRHWRMYDRFVAAAERIVGGTGTKQAPWVVLDGSDPNRRSVQAGEYIAERLRLHLEKTRERAKAEQGVSDSAREADREAEKGSEKGAGKDVRKGAGSKGATCLAGLDLSHSLDKKAYRDQLIEYQALLNRLYRRAKERGISTVLVFEGWDAAGKGGAIRRLTAALDARGYRVISTAAPTDEELAHHYMWRFWKHLPSAGRVTIFDRSWYGRVLVERVEGFATPQEWKRAYDEINEFESQLTDHGLVVLKFWFHISPEEQKRRFEARAETPHKRWKLTEEDWRNRGKWGAYELAVDDMVGRTDTPEAPWILVEGEDKAYARVKVLRELCQRLRRALD